MAKKKEFELPAKTDGWLATYSDMMTLLMCFFVLLFAMSNVDADKFAQLAASLANNSRESILSGGSGDGLTERMGNGIMEMPMIKRNDTQNDPDIKGGADSEFQKMASDFKTYFAEHMATPPEITMPDPDTMVLTFPDGVLFDSGSAEIKSEALSTLDFIGNELVKYPGMLIEIEGHTDNLPINTVQFPSNWHLSFARAASVGLFFIEQKGMSPYNISPIGRSHYLNIDTNDTAIGRARNRRVEIKLRNVENSESIIVANP